MLVFAPSWFAFVALSVPDYPSYPFILHFCTSLSQHFLHLIFFSPRNLFLLAQACQHGNSQHLEHLLFYGADSASQNASGNTALHICALYNKVTRDFTKDCCYWGVGKMWHHTFK